jgi:hypothetical protein
MGHGRDVVAIVVDAVVAVVAAAATAVVFSFIMCFVQ